MSKITLENVNPNVQICFELYVQIHKLSCSVSNLTKTLNVILNTMEGKELKEYSNKVNMFAGNEFRKENGKKP